MRSDRVLDEARQDDCCRRRLSASSPMLCIRFCSVTMPTICSPSITGTSERPRPALMRRKCHAERILQLRHLKGARHDRLHVAIAIHLQRFQNPLLRNHADQQAAADHGKIVLQAVNRFVDCIFERVGGRQQGEVRQHDVAHSNGIDHGLEDESLVFQLCADKDEKPGQHQPWILPEYPGDKQTPGR